MDDISHFVSEDFVHPSITQLVGEAWIHNLTQRTKWCALVSKMAPSLTQLHLKLFCGVWDGEIPTQTRFLTGFPHLASLTLYLAWERKTEANLIQGLMPSFTGIKSITLPNASYNGKRVILRELGRKTEEGLAFPQLTEIAVEETFHLILTALLALPQNLVKIDLGRLMVGHFYPADLEELIWKHRHYMETLTFDMKTEFWKFYDIEGQPKFQDIPKNFALNFPAMPKLTELQVLFEDQKMQLNNGTRVRYAIHFPQLRKLTLSTTLGCEVSHDEGNVWTTFFGDTEQIVENVDLKISWEKHDNCETCTGLEQTLRKMFPRITEL